MLVFVGIGTLLFFLTFFGYEREHRLAGKLLALLVCSALTFVFMFQYNIGGDYLAYEHLYGASTTELLLRGFAPGFIILFQTLSSLDLPFQYLYIFLGPTIMALTVSGYMTICKQYNVSFSLVLFLFFSWLYLDYLGVLRQALAQSVLVFGYAQLLLKRRAFALSLTLLAPLFHLSAIFFFVFYIYKFFPMKILTKLLLTVVFSFIFVVFGGVNLISEAWVALKLPFHTYFTSTVWLAKETTIYSKVVTLALVLTLAIVVRLKKRLSIPNDLIFVFASYTILRAFTIDWHAGHRVLMLFEPFLIVFFAFLVERSISPLFKQKAAIVFCAITLFFTHMLGNQFLRLNDDPNYYNFSLSFGQSGNQVVKLDVIK